MRTYFCLCGLLKYREYERHAAPQKERPKRACLRPSLNSSAHGQIPAQIMQFNKRVSRNTFDAPSPMPTLYAAAER